jgi:hypothetical protein
VLSAEAGSFRKEFFDVIFGRIEGGYVCIARRARSVSNLDFDERFFRWPQELGRLVEFIESSAMTHDLWFSPMTFVSPRRLKENVDVCPGVWSDLDECPIAELLIQPTITIQSSTERHQALWLTTELLEPVEAEALSKRIAYTHAEAGADKSGWDLTQLLRIPYTYNFKYNPPALVDVVESGDSTEIEQLRNLYPRLEHEEYEFPFPEEVEEANVVLARYRTSADYRVWPLIQLEPRDDWSAQLWRLEMLLAESGFTREEIFAVARSAACNKYRRDGKSERLLWREVCKAWGRVVERTQTIPDANIFTSLKLLSDIEIAESKKDITFVDRFVAWARTTGDAAHQYFHAGAFMCLSCILAGNVKLPTSFGTIIPNLWILLLGDTTLTRKTTSMDIAVDMLLEVDPDVVMATDGSIEGLMEGLSTRPGRPSLFLRDEFSGMVEMMARREYYAGMMEALTKLYDGKFQKRLLRRGTVEVREPILMLFAGGIRSRTLSLLSEDFVVSGFLPRFIFVLAEPNLNMLRPIGPPTTDTKEGRSALVKELIRMRLMYCREIETKIAGSTITQRRITNVQLSSDAWALYNDLEKRLVESGLHDARQDTLTPMMDRLAKSGLKAAVLIATSRCEDAAVTVETRDIIKAFTFVIDWRDYALEVAANAGVTAFEKRIQKIMTLIQKYPGVTRSIIMQRNALLKRDTDIILDTLEQRGSVSRIKHGRTEKIFPIEEP